MVKSHSSSVMHASSPFASSPEYAFLFSPSMRRQASDGLPSLACFWSAVPNAAASARDKKGTESCVRVSMNYASTSCAGVLFCARYEKG